MSTGTFKHKHKAVERLLQQAKKCGDPEPLVGRMRVAASSWNLGI